MADAIAAVTEKKRSSGIDKHLRDVLGEENKPIEPTHIKQTLMRLGNPRTASILAERVQAQLDGNSKAL